MNVIVCLDDNRGMMFNKRRQSRDRVLNGKILEISKDSRLFMSEYSAKLFGDEENIVVADDVFLAEKGDFCFVEGELASLENCEALYVFLWNRSYPADVYFAFDIEKEGFLLEKTDEFVGSSHEKITLNIYRR